MSSQVADASGVVPVSAVLPAQVSIGVLAAAVPWFALADAVAACGVREKRGDGKLPAHVVAYLTMGLCLFAQDSYEEVAAKVTGALSSFGTWNAAWGVPTASAITQARKRLGPDVLRRVFEQVAAPVGEVETRGVWLRELRLMAIDGFELDVPDTPGNAEAFGYAGSGDNRSAFPKVRVVAVAECGTHAFVDAEVAGIGVGEKTVAAPLLDRLDQGWLLTADRGFYSFDAWCAAADAGAELLWRAPTQLGLPLVGVLPDGTFLSVLVDPKIRAADIDPDRISFAKTLNIIRRTATGTAAFPP